MELNRSGTIPLEGTQHRSIPNLSHLQQSWQSLLPYVSVAAVLLALALAVSAVQSQTGCHITIDGAGAHLYGCELIQDLPAVIHEMKGQLRGLSYQNCEISNGDPTWKDC
ncbi:TPA_asm: triple gene block protein 3 [Cardamom virus X]|nr:TPA_asm: triple gene block protein 3 [Cardamom virus X]